VTRRVDQVDQELVACQNNTEHQPSESERQRAWRKPERKKKEGLTVGLLGDISDILLVKGEVHRDGGRLDSDTTLFLVITEPTSNRVEPSTSAISGLGFKEEKTTHRVSVNRMSPALAPAIIPALDTKESVKVDLPWSTWAITDMLRIWKMGPNEGEQRMGWCEETVDRG
jgi:hypothetical protein